jgi:hypothetical protein
MNILLDCQMTKLNDTSTANQRSNLNFLNSLKLIINAKQNQLNKS